MAKRFTDTDKWRKPFIRTLSVEEKLFWFYMLDKCSNAGIWVVDFELAQFEIGILLDENYLIKKFGEKIQVIDEGKKWFIPSFLEFQQPKGLSEVTNWHKAILDELKKYNLHYNQHTGSSCLTLPQELDNCPGIGNGISNSLGSGNAKSDESGLLYDEKLKDFDKFVSFFPLGKNYYEPHSMTLWENLPQRDKELCIELTPLYIKHQTQIGKENYIKNIRKFLEEGFYRQLNENQTRYLGQKIIPKTKTKIDSDEELRKKLFG